MTAEKDIVIRKDDNYTLYMDIYMPENQGKAPCVMWIHGGAWCVHELTRTYMPDELMKWVEEGFVVASCEYRLSDEAVWPAQLEDCRYDLDYLFENADKYGIDKENIFVWGESAGGHLATFIANDGKVRGACIWYPLTYFENLEKEKPEYVWCRDLIGKEDFNTKENLAVISPALCVSKNTCQCLVMHGDADTLVDISQSEMLMEKLKENGVDATFIKVHNQGHGFFQGSENYDVVLKWMKEKVKKQKSVDTLKLL